MLVVAAVSVLAAAVIVVLRYRALLFTTFDPEVADASGVRTARTDALLMLVLAAVDPGDDAGARRDAGRRDARDPGRSSRGC